MYGLGGSFGSMPYQSPANSLFHGIEAGASLALRFREEQDRREHLQDERARQDRIEQMQQAHNDFIERHQTDQEQRQNQKDALSALNNERDQMYSMYSGLIDEYGGDPNKVPPEVAKPWADAFADWNHRYSGANRAIYNNFLQDQQHKAQTTATSLAAGELDPADPKNAQDIAHMLAVNTHRDPADYLKCGPNQPSVVEQGISDFNDGMQSGDRGKLSNAMGTIMGPQMEGGRIGMLNRVGGVVTDVAPHPDRPFVPTPDGQAFYPVLQTTAQHNDGHISTENYAAPTAAGYDHPDDPSLISITPQKATNYVGQLGTLQAALTHPDAQQNLRDTLQNPDRDTLDAAHAFSAMGLMMGKKAGGNIERTRDADGNETLVFVPGDHSNPRQIWPPPGDSPAAKQTNQYRAANEVFQGGGSNPDTGKPWKSPNEVMQFELQHRYEKPDRSSMAEREAEIQRLQKLPPGQGGITPEQAQEARLSGLGIGGPKAALESPTEAHQEALQARTRAEETAGVYPDPDNPGGFKWTGADGKHKPDSRVAGADMQALMKQRNDAYEQAYSTGIGSRRGIAGPSGGGRSAVQAAPGSGTPEAVEPVVTAPPPMEQREPGKTTINTPRGKLTWTRDPNTGKVGWAKAGSAQNTGGASAGF